MSGDLLQEFDVWHEQIPMFSMPCLVHGPSWSIMVPGAPLSARGTSSDRGPSKMQTLPSGLEENAAMEPKTEPFLMMGFI